MNADFSILFQGTKKHICSKGQILIQASVVPRGVHFIISGYVKTYNITRQGDKQLAEISGPGDIFPLHWSLDEDPREVFYEAMTPMTYQIIPKTAFKGRYLRASSCLL